MKSFLQICVLFIAVHRTSSQGMYTGRLRDPGFGARGGPRVGSAMRSPRIFPTRGTSFGFGQTRSFQTGGRPGFQSRDTFGPSSFTSSFDGTGSRHGSGIQPSRGSSGGRREDPADIRRILGSSILNRELRFGERGLPRHGGAGAGEEFSNGLMRGWDGNPQTLGNRFQNEWSDPLRGQPIPRLPPRFDGNFRGIPGFPAFG